MKTISNSGPMRASSEIVTDFDAVQYPIVASPKIDGWRCYHHNGPRTRKGFLIPNFYTRAMLMSERLTGLDGELVAGSPTDPNAMQAAQSAFASQHGEPDFTWYVFDDWRRDTEYWKYYKANIQSQQRELPSFVKVLPQELITNAQALDQFSSVCKADGYEGVIIRSPDSPYKYGRSTRKQGWMLKVKPYVYEEAIIVTLNEKTHNANELERDNFGYAKRSSAQAGKVPAGTLGSFTVCNAKGKFNIGCGHLNDFDKQHLWNIKSALLGKAVTFKYLDHGTKKVPRHGQFVAFRARED